MTTTAKPVHARILRKLITIDGDDMHGHPQTHEAGALVALTADEAAHLVDAGIAARAAVEGDATQGREPGRTFDIRLTRNATSLTWTATAVLDDLGLAIVARDPERSIALVALEDAVEEALSYVRED
ncbi:MAG: hypothetical protein HOO96_35995 [Polyangiaceae bacterium]|nr:hypothetical protein [Polyangiaceae bacterium]